MMIEYTNLNTEDLQYLRGSWNKSAEDLESKIDKLQQRLDDKVARNEADNAVLNNLQSKLESAQAILTLVQANGNEEDIGVQQSIVDEFQNQYSDQLAAINGLTPREVQVQVSAIMVLEAQRQSYISLVDEIDAHMAA